MRTVKNLIKSLTSVIFFLPRKIYYSKKKKDVENQRPTIISNDCFAGIVYHNLGLKFYSPTINLFLSKEDFITFVNNLKGFLQSEIKEAQRNARNYPIGELEYNSKKIKLHFLHYKTFDEAIKKWDQRKNRIDYSNILIVLTVAKGLTAQDVVDFKNIPFENKLLITDDKSEYTEDFIIEHKIFRKKNYKSGEFLRFKAPFFYRRHMDDIDYVSFINSLNQEEKQKSLS